jgi:type II secretory pathway pseudopilin PulG
MNYCPNCGTRIPEGAKFCPNCQQSLMQIQRPEALQTPPPIPASMSKTSGMAIASLILGILGLLFFLLGIAGLILGIIALNKIRQSAGALRGSGLAIGGIITGSFSIFFIPIIGILAAIAIPNFLKFQAKAKQSEAKTNLQAIFSAQTNYYMDSAIYASDFESLKWHPPGDKTRYAYFLENDIIQPDIGNKIYNSPKDVEQAYSDESGFRVLAVGNIDADDTLDVWEINETKKLTNIINDVNE